MLRDTLSHNTAQMKDNQVCNYDQFIDKAYLVGGCAVGDAEVEAEDLPGALVVQDDALGAEVARGRQGRAGAAVAATTWRRGAASHLGGRSGAAPQVPLGQAVRLREDCRARQTGPLNLP